MQTLTFNEAIDKIARGKGNVAEVANEMVAPPEGNREDLPDAAISAGFKQTIASFQGNYPYVDNAWVDRIADELKSGADLATIKAAAEMNRGQYLDKARVDAGGNWDTWDAIFRALDKMYMEPKP